MPVSFRDFSSALQRLEINPNSPVIAHGSLSAFGRVQGSGEAVVGALLSAFQTVIMPTFTYKTMLTPEEGPPDNAMSYGASYSQNRLAEFYTPHMPADRLMGILPETLRQRPEACRSGHPILSFSGINAGDYLAADTRLEPLQPIRKLYEAGGWVLLLGVDHTVNTSIHYGERLAGRKQFLRWALTPHGVQECPGFPGCSLGFEAAAAHLNGFQRQVALGDGEITAVSLHDLILTVKRILAADPLALLCDQPDCERCAATRKKITDKL